MAPDCRSVTPAARMAGKARKGGRKDSGGDFLNGSGLLLVQGYASIVKHSIKHEAAKVRSGKERSANIAFLASSTF